VINSKLSLQQAPPLSVPARFFVIAPVFGVAASLILLFSGELLLISRWTRGMLAITHCLVLGFFASIMIGAIQQMLPVLAGAVIPRPRLIAAVIYSLWLPAVASLVAAFIAPAAWLFMTAMVLLTGAVLSFLGAVMLTLWQSEARSESVLGIKIAIFSLLVTLVLGVMLTAGYAGMLPLWRPVMTDLHLSWGLVGWVAVLIMSIAWQVVPMFQITPAYPVWIRRSIVPVSLVLLLVKSLLAGLDYSLWVIYAGRVADLLIAGGLMCFAVVTLRLQSKARRKVRDSHRDFWRLAMYNLIAAVIIWMLAEVTGNPLLDLLAATLFLLGFAMAVVTGMLLKIISFLVWLHLTGANDALQMAGKAGIKVPKMKGVISARCSDALLMLLMIAEVAIVVALIFPHLFAELAAVLWLGYFVLLGLVISRAMQGYYKIARTVNPNVA
jgi:hypothetical protein